MPGSEIIGGLISSQIIGDADPGPLVTYGNIAANLLGTSNLWTFFDDFLYGGNSGAAAPPGWGADTAGSGGSIPSSAGSPAGFTEYGGIYQWYSGATAASKGGARQWGQLFHVADKPFYIAARMRCVVNAGLAAQTAIGMGITDASFARSIEFGYWGALVAANFSVQHSAFEGGSALDLGVPVDANFHVFELWAKGTTTIFARIDGGPIVSVVANFAGMNNLQGLKTYAANGTDAIYKCGEANWVFSAGAR